VKVLKLVGVFGDVGRMARGSWLVAHRLRSTSTGRSKG
jgi:hypothetical protein